MRNPLSVSDLTDKQLELVRFICGSCSDKQLADYVAMTCFRLKDLKKGDFFTLQPIHFPKNSYVYRKGEYDHSEKKYWCASCSDLSYERLVPGNRIVFTMLIY